MPPMQEFLKQADSFTGGIKMLTLMDIAPVFGQSW